MIVPAFICGILFTSCSSKTESDDYEKLEGATWVSETDNVIYTLRFVDKTVCILSTARQDNASANLTTYRWRYQSIHDSVWALFHMYPIDEEGHYYGRVENNKLFLHINDENNEVLCFERKK